jgi:hypothetical protein
VTVIRFCKQALNIVGKDVELIALQQQVSLPPREQLRS